MNIVVVYNTPSKRVKKDSQYIVSDEDTQSSAREVAQALRLNGATVRLFPVDETNIDSIASIRADVIFNLIEWTGLDLPLARRAIEAIEKTGIPFTGATSEVSCRMADKVTHKKDLDRIGSPTPAWQGFVTGTETIRPDLPYPMIVKPALEHCSIGIGVDRIAPNARMLKRIVQEQIAAYRQTVIAEEFIEGEEYQVTILEVDGLPRVLPPAEIYYRNTKERYHLLTYEGRWDESHPDYHDSGVRLAIMPDTEKIEDICRTTFRKLRYRDYARFDIREKGNKFYILEANANPGLGDDDDYGMTVSYKAVGMTFADFIRAIVASSVRRFKKQSE